MNTSSPNGGYSASAPSARDDCILQRGADRHRHSASARRPARAILGAIEHGGASTPEGVWARSGGANEGTHRPMPSVKKDERRASPPAFITPEVSLPGHRLRSAEWHSAMGTSVPPSGAHQAVQRVGLGRFVGTAQTHPVAVQARSLGRVAPIPSRTIAGHMAPDLREPCRYGPWALRRTMYACSPIPSYPCADCSSSASTALPPKLSAITSLAMALSSLRRRVSRPRVRPLRPGQTLCYSTPTSPVDGGHW